MVSRQALIGNSCSHIYDSYAGRDEVWKLPSESASAFQKETPLHSSHSSYEERQRQIEVEDLIWKVRHTTVIAKTKQYLEESDSTKVEVEE